MERLTLQDERALLDFLREIYKVGGFDSFVAHLLSGLARLVPNSLTAYCEMKPREATSQNWIRPEDAITPAQYSAWHQFMHEHPVLHFQAHTGNCRARKISDFYTQAHFHRLGLYSEFYRPLNIRDVLCFGLSVQAPRVIGIALHRDRRSYTERDRLLLNLCRPHLVQAWINAKKVARLQYEARLLKHTLEKLDRGIVVLGGSGRVRIMTPRARQCVAEFFGAENSLRYRLPEDLERWIRAQEDSFEQPDVPPPQTPMVIEHAGKRLIVRLVFDAHQRLLLLEEHAEVQPATLQKLGLTRREAEVLAWVERGKTNSEIATILGISERTVQKHVEHIFIKLGVETRTAAATRALQAAEELEEPALVVP